MEGLVVAAGGDVSLHNFSARLWEQLVHFHVMRLTDSLFLWVGATPHLRNLAVAMCSRYDSIPSWPAGDGEAAVCPVLLFQDSIPVSTSLLGDTSDTTSTGLAQRLGLGGKTGLACECGVERGLSKGHEAECSTPPTPQHTSCGPASGIPRLKLPSNRHPASSS
ncbi:PSMG4 isoform 4 [Pan troglodytes]|uniref:PSMG4 isoform 4 n=1 Tax=Pan troglodytes TaxID=9598 RepID=A0A2J8MU08_PANTR|nr:PSMG4 isoform 4 [Pan troglodytes]